MSRTDRNETIKAVSLFSGLGGLDIGLHQAGIETVVCIEKDRTAAQTLKINSQKHEAQPAEEHITVPEKYPWTVIDEDIHGVGVADILEAGGVSKNDVDLVVGGPPCQTFSRSNEGRRLGTDAEKGRLYEEFARILHELEPTAFIFENVRGLKSANDGKDFETIQDTLEGDTYTSDYSVLNAADYGVPQTRKRIFIVGTRQEQPSFPDPTHTEDGSEGTNEWITVGKALAEFDIDEAIEAHGGYQNAIGSKYGPLLKDIPEGANYQHFSERKYDPEQEEYVERAESELDEKRFDWRSRHWNYLLKIDRERPSWTIQADPGTTVGPFHWRARKLTFLEQMKLMDLPLDYYIAGPPGAIQQQIGNAVPPGLAAAVADELVQSLGLTPTAFTTVDYQDHSAKCDADQPVPFTIEVDTEESPWAIADSILSTIHSADAVVVEAQQQAIPLALDVLEIAKRQTRRELHVDLDKRIIGDEQEERDVVSALEAKVVTEKATINPISTVP